MTKLMLILPIMSLCVLVGCAEEYNASKEITSRPASLFTVEQQQHQRVVQLPATIEAAKKTVLTFQVPGLLKELDLKEGQEVKQGELLARLDQRNFKNAVNSAHAQLRQAKAEYKRAKVLREQKAISQSLLDQRRTQLDIARATYDDARKRLEDSSLVAPYDAIVAKLYVKRFENIAPQQVVATLLSKTGSNAVIQVPASLMIRSENDQPERVELVLDAAPDVSIPVTLHEAAASADPATQTFEVRYAFNAPDDLLILPGMTGTLTGYFSATQSKLSGLPNIPVSSVVSREGQTFVWLVDPGTMKVARRDIVVSAAKGDLVSVSGVAAGDTLVKKGGHYLQEGAVVRAFEE